MDKLSLEDFVARIGYAGYPGDEKLRQYTDVLIANLPEEQTHSFYVSLNVKSFPQQGVDPSKFATRQEWRQYLIDEKKKFLASELASFRSLLENIGVNYDKDHVLRVLSLDLTKQQAQQIRYHRSVKEITAYHPREPQIGILANPG